MANITSSGIGSGLDIAGLVQQLVAAERRPTEFRIARQEARVQAKLSGFGSLKSSLSAFNDQLKKMQTLESFLTRKATASIEDYLTVSVGETAVPATYSVEVRVLAQAQKLETNSFTGSDAVVGTGTLSIAVSTESFDVEIDSSNNTLEGIRDAINHAIDNKGVAATIVNSDTGSYLILTGDNTGSDQTMIITQAGGDGGLSALEYDPPNGLNSLTEIAQALDSEIRVDGHDVTSDSNTVVDAIDGVTLNLVAAKNNKITDVTVANDVTAVRAQVDSFVSAYNELIDTFDSLTAFDPESKVAASLLGDSTIRGVRDQIRRELSIAVTDIDASFNTLSGLGIETELGGKLSVDSSKLDAVLDTEFTKLGQLFASSDGYAARLADVVDRYLDDTDGIIKIRTDGLDASIEGFGEQRERLDLRMARIEARLQRQFNGLDLLIGELTTTSNFLTQQLAALPGIVVSK